MSQDRITAIILAGGQGKRLDGRDKASIELDGITLLDRRVSLLKSLCSEIIVVSNESYTAGGVGYRLVGDRERDVGPLMALYSGLAGSNTRKNFVTACDMPFLVEGLFNSLKAYSDSYDAVIPRIGSFFEPLFAFYSRECMDAIEKMLMQSRRRIASFFNRIKIRFVEEEEIRHHDSALLSFFNINTSEDLRKARSLASEHRELPNTFAGSKQSTD